MLLAAGTVLGLGTVGTLAAWTDTSRVTTGTFSVGRLDLKLGTTSANTVDSEPSTFTSTFTMTGMRPGDSATANLVVRNAGSLPLRYTVAGTATNNGTGANQLGNALEASIFASTCSGTRLNPTPKLTFTGLGPRSLAAGNSETLCLQATLPATAPPELQGTSTVGTLTFTATNP